MKKTPAAGFSAAAIAAARKAKGTTPLGNPTPAKAAAPAQRPARQPRATRTAAAAPATATVHVTASASPAAPAPAAKRKVARVRAAATSVSPATGATPAAAPAAGTTPAAATPAAPAVNAAAPGAIPPVIPPPVIQPAATGQPAQTSQTRPAPTSPGRLKRAWNWSMDHLKSFGNGLRKRWPLLVLLVIATVLGIWAYRNRDNIAKGFDLMRTKVSNKGATGPSKPAGADRGQPIDKTDNSETTKSQQQVLPALAGMSNLPPAMMVDANSANNISVGMTNVVFGGSNNTTYVGSQVLINNSSNVFIYNGLGHSTPANRADNARPIQIPGPCTGTKGVQGYHWTTNLVAGQCLPYIYDRSQWKMKTSHTFTDPDLKVEVLGLDGSWHVVPSNGINTIIATGARYTVSPNATDTVQLEFWLIPRN